MKRRAVLSSFGALIGASAISSCAQIPTAEVTPAAAQQSQPLPQQSLQLRGTGDLTVAIASADNSNIQVFDSETLEQLVHLKPGPGVLHMEFSPRGESVWMSVGDNHQINLYDTESFQLQTQLSLPSPSGIFMTARAHKIGL